MSEHPTDREPVELAACDWSFVGGEWYEDAGEHHLRGQMYAERYVPVRHTQPYPVVMWHGGVQTGTNFTATPDGRRGWLHDFLRAGFTVYVVDQPERGRSGHAMSGGTTEPMQRYGAERVEQRFTGLRKWQLWPQAGRHTQWPGEGVMGDPHFDRFFASQVEMLADRDEIERLNRDAGVALVDAIGPCILLTHSQSGPFGWLVADARPDRVKAVLALEPNGPPFREITFHGAPDWFRYDESIGRAHGITRVALTFDPPIDTPAALQPALDDSSASEEHCGAYLQGGTPHRLPNLAQVKILIMTAEASYHAIYDHCTSEFLRQAGVEHDFVRLDEHGFKGNGHMVMLEKNNHEVADFMLDWLADNLKPDADASAGDRTG